MLVKPEFAMLKILASLTVNKQLLNVLVCPKSGGKLIISPDGKELWCRASGLAYPIEQGIPVMLVEQARTLTADEVLKK